jgi:ribonuclease D
MEYIETQTRLEAVARGLDGAGLLAVDTEAAGYHRYRDDVCLLQLSTRSETFVVDTLAVDGLEPLRDLLADPVTEVILHDADYDLRLLDRDYTLRVEGLFDTKVAARFLGETAFGLQALLERFLDVRLAKKYQRADWARRPLPPDMLEYAAEDTRHLPRLRDVLQKGLVEADRLRWAEEEFRLIEQVAWEDGDDAQPFFRVKGTRDLGPRQLAVLRAAYAWREEEARRRDAAPFRVLSNDALVNLARTMPGKPPELARTPGVPGRLGGQEGEPLARALAGARDLPEEELPVRPSPTRRPPPDPVVDARVDRLRRVRDERAEALGLERGFLMPRHQLELLAREAPRTLEALEAIAGVRRWQVEGLGYALLAAM